MSNTERGAVIGAGAGGVVGAVIGEAAGSTTKGAIIGAVIGGAAGAVIGNRMDDKAEELANELPNATVERVGEGLLVTFASGILFDFDSSNLRAEARANLDELAGALVDEEEDYELMIAGHTDAVGTESYNQTLSERRAEAATRYIVAAGMDRGRIRVVGMGEAEPVESNETADGQQANRRVEVAIFASEEYRERMIRAHGG
jgi:outer membrane protein OmpA-like peptidoglycan-associated protein